MSQKLDIEKNIAITSANKISKIVRPLQDAFNVRFFRYLRLYKSGKRVLLSNIPDAIRYMYGEGHYQQMWYDGEYPEFLQTGWYVWALNRLDNKHNKQLENTIIELLKVCHGLTYVEEGALYYEIYCFDSDNTDIYKLDKSILYRFINYFKEQSQHLINIGESEAIILPIKNILQIDSHASAYQDFVKATASKRHYLGAKFNNAYLTQKELDCVRWLLEGKSTVEISVLENASPRTIQSHIDNIKMKFNCTKQTQLIRMILTAGLQFDTI